MIGWRAMVNPLRARAVTVAAVVGTLSLLVLVLAGPTARAAPTEVAGSGDGATRRIGPLQLGAAAPPIAAERLSGQDGVSLEDLRGRVVVLDFWATWCGPCRAIMPDLDAMHRRHHPRGLTVLGVAREPEGRIRAHLSEHPVGYTVARDVGGTLSRYGVRALPMLVVIDRGGQVRDVVVGTDDASLRRLDTFVQRLLSEPAR